jgi:hypothetical protein
MMNLMKQLKTVALPFLVAFFNCCGYSARSLLPSYLKTIAIPLVTNQTIRPQLGEQLTDRLITDFNQDGHLRVVSGTEGNLVLECRITNYTKIPPAYNADQKVYAWRITIDAQVKCEDMVRYQTLWENPVSGWVTYDPNTQSEDDGIKEAIGKLSDEIIRKTITAW